MITRISLGKGPTLYFLFMGEPILMGDLVGPKTFVGPTIPLTYHGSLLKRQSQMKLLFMQTG